MMIMIMKMMMMIMPAPAGWVGWEELEIVCVGSFPHCQDVQVLLKSRHNRRSDLRECSSP